jgi:hypothetical protein
MSTFLSALFKNIFPTLKFRVVHHEGKDDLKKSIINKLKAHSDANIRVIVLVDQDSSPDCKKLKQNIDDLCKKSGKENYKIRIVCHELESWYLGDLASIDVAFGTNLARDKGKKKYREPDKIANAKQMIKRITKQAGQIYIASKIGSAMTPESIAENKSKSFQSFLNALDF